MPEVAQVMETANANRQRFEAFCRALTPPQLASPIPDTHWQVRDYIAHLASIDLYVAEWFEHECAGERWRPAGADGGPFSIDEWNDARIDERADASVDDLLDEAATHRARLWEAVGRFQPELLARQFNFRGNATSFLRYLQLWTAHDPAHTADMLRGLEPRDRTPAVDEWLKGYRL